jgi:predicted acetyltransferase
LNEVDISIARPEERVAIENMMQLYVHDFTEQWAGEARGELGDDGRFDDYPLDPYWGAEGHIPLLLWRDGHLVGFALVNDHGHGERPVDRNMAEFFIARKHRRGGAGTAAARAIFSLYPGVWEAAVARRNRGALAFWRRAIGGHPGVSDVEETDYATKDWNGPILRFRIP